MERTGRLLWNILLWAAMAYLPTAIHAQTGNNPSTSLYQVYSSTATPPHYKRVIARIIRNTNPLARPIQISTQPAGTEVSLGASYQTFSWVDLYAFPNPARHGDKPTIRVQAGAADAVELRIYDASGRLVHEADLTNPQVLDDGNGNGSQITFDYLWDTGKLGSGIYLCAVTAKKGGMTDLKKVIKIAIVK